MKKIMILAACGLVLGGCANAYPPPRVLLDQSIIDLMGPPQVVEVTVGSPVEGQPEHFYRFQATPGQQVTMVVRSKGPDTGLLLYGDPDDYRRGAAPLAQVLPLAGPFSSLRDPDGLHSHLIMALPDDPDGHYALVVTPLDASDYSITVLDGVVPQRELMPLPEPIYGNTGKFMSPFTEDRTVTPWVEKGLQVSVAGNVGSALGSLAASSSDNLLLAVAGGVAGHVVGTEVVLKAMGGWDYIKDNSDMSFDTVEEMARYLVDENGSHPQYKQVLNATYGIYPELRNAIKAVEWERSMLAKLYPHSFVISAQH